LRRKAPVTKRGREFAFGEICLEDDALGGGMFVSASPLEYLVAYALVVLFGMAVGFLLGWLGRLE